MEGANNVPIQEEATMFREEQKGLLDMISELKLQVGQVTREDARATDNPAINMEEALAPHLLA